MEYRGIDLFESVKLFKKDGNYNQKIKNSLDGLAEMLLKNGHELLSKYKGNHNKLLINFKCEHNPNWIEPANYKLGKGCPECGDIIRAEKRAKQSKEEFPLLVKYNGHEWVDGKYINARTKVKINFNCGHDAHWITPDNYKHGFGCPKCAGRDHEQAKENLLKLVNSNGHIIISEYIKDNEKILIDFKCDHNPHWVLPGNYKKGSGCPVCSESKGEKRIREWLEENGIKFKAQKEFDGLIGLGSGNLSFDFFLHDYNLLIEFQGEFHDGSNGEYTILNLEYQQEHDKRKREYCKDNNINLLEIWYWDFDNIERILSNEINECNFSEVM